MDSLWPKLHTNEPFSLASPAWQHLMADAITAKMILLVSIVVRSLADVCCRVIPMSGGSPGPSFGGTTFDIGMHVNLRHCQAS